MDNAQANIKLDTDDFKLLSSIRSSIYSALVGEVNPGLRAIFVDWTPGSEYANIFFYHNGIITDAIQSHYSSIMTEAGADSWQCRGQIIGDSFEILRLDYPYELPLIHTDVVYRRKEPFIDPTEHK